jgi:uroporphyrinogen III methyltransferase/synthase
MPSMPSARRAGLVVLVGAGPGEESLLTLAAVQWLSLADTIVYDRLVNAAVLRRCRKDALRVYVGKTPGKEGHDQASINRLLVQRARAGELVVRLKGGDPFIFGRGGEEASALVEAGVPYRVVPGITAALAAGAYAGMPLTDRRVASTVALVTGQEDTGKPESNIDWRALAGIDTVVMYMGSRNLGQLAANLISGGRSPQTPAALVANASTPRQKTILATLGTLAAEARKAGLAVPHRGGRRARRSI